MVRKKIQGSSFYKKYPSLLFIAKWLSISGIVGILVGSASAVFLVSLDWVGNFRESHLWMIALLPLAGLAIGYSYYKWGQPVEAGNNLLIDRIVNPSQERIPFRMAPMVLLGTLATHLLGGSAGREGTALQMAGAISDQLTKPLKLNATDRKILLISAIAAGFSSVFGTPLAGAIFALEVVVIGKMKYDAIFPRVHGSHSGKPSNQHVERRAHALSNCRDSAHVGTQLRLHHCGRNCFWAHRRRV